MHMPSSSFAAIRNSRTAICVASSSRVNNAKLAATLTFRNKRVHTLNYI